MCKLINSSSSINMKDRKIAYCVMRKTDNDRIYNRAYSWISGNQIAELYYESNARHNEPFDAEPGFHMFVTYEECKKFLYEKYFANRWSDSRNYYGDTKQYDAVICECLVTDPVECGYIPEGIDGQHMFVEKYNTKTILKLS